MNKHICHIYKRSEAICKKKKKHVKQIIFYLGDKTKKRKKIQIFAPFIFIDVARLSIQFSIHQSNL